MDRRRKVAGQKLLTAAQEFWDACRAEGQDGAVQWLEGSGGELLIYTRGEYRKTLLTNVHALPDSKVTYFQGEVVQ